MEARKPNGRCNGKMHRSIGDSIPRHFHDLNLALFCFIPADAGEGGWRDRLNPHASLLATSRISTRLTLRAARQASPRMSLAKLIPEFELHSDWTTFACSSCEFCGCHDLFLWRWKDLSVRSLFLCLLLQCFIPVGFFRSILRMSGRVELAELDPSALHRSS